MKRSLMTLALLALIGPALAQADPKAGPLFDRALKAMAKAPTVPADKAQAEWDRAVALLDACIKAGDEKYTARAHFHKALCYEAMEPPRIQDALGSYGQVTAGDLAARAADKVKRAGVDVYVARFKAALRTWREADANNEAAFETLKKDAWEKINALALGAKAAPGLIAALGDDDSIVRDFAAERLPDIVDAEGIAEMIAASRSSNPTLVAGVSSAIRRVINVYAHAASLDRQAEALEQKLKIAVIKIDPLDAGTWKDNPKAADINKATASCNAKYDELMAKMKEAVDDLHKKADEVRKNIPKEGAQELVAVTEEIKKLIADPAARTEARVEGIRIAEELGDLEGALVDALIETLKDPASEIRVEAARALGSVKKSGVEDRQKAATRLQDVVQYEPEKAAEADGPDWKANAFVRSSAAYGLSRLGIVTSCPSLIEALDDNDARVREAAHTALVVLRGSRLTLGDEAGEKKGTDIFDPDAAAEARKTGVEAWGKWWEGSQGVEVLVGRYRDFANSWTAFDTTLFYDKDYLMRRLKTRGMIIFPNEPAKAEALLKIADENLQRFNTGKEILKNEVVALGAPVAGRLLEFIGGESGSGGPEHPSMRLFVAQCLAEIARSDSGTKDAVRTLLIGSGATPAKQIGAAFCLGMMGEAAGAPERDALAKEGLAREGGALREACARALGLIGPADYSRELIGAAKSLVMADDAQERAAIAICDAVGRGKKADGSDLLEIGKMASTSESVMVREAACWALGEIGKAEAVPFLILARVDILVNVRLAAKTALKQIVEKEAAVAGQVAAVAGSQAGSAEAGRAAAARERAGACLALGDAGRGAAAEILSVVLLGKGKTKAERRRFPADTDPGVRAAAAEAFGNMAETAAKPPKAGVRALIEALVSDEAAPVRAAAFASLQKIGTKVGAELPQVDGAPYSPLKSLSAAGSDAFNLWATSNEAKFE